MGYFLDINSDDSLRAKNVAQYNLANGKSGHTMLGVIASQMGPSIFMSVLNKVATSSDGKGASKDKNISEDEQIEVLQKELKKALSAIGASSASEIDATISEAEKTKDANIKKAQDEVDAFSNNTDKYSVEIANLQTQILTGADLTEEQKANNKKIENKIEDLKSKKEKALAKAKKNLENVTVSETKKYEEIVVNADKAKNINYQLEKLKALDDSQKTNLSYDPQSEVDDLASFNKARKNFLNNKNKETAQALKDVFENVDSENTKALYKKYFEKEVEGYLKNNVVNN